MPSRRNSGSQYSATRSKLLGSEIEYTRQMTCARVSWLSRWGRDLGLAVGQLWPSRRSEVICVEGEGNDCDLHDVSTIDVVTSSGVTSGGMVTSGTTCWTWSQ